MQSRKRWVKFRCIGTLTVIRSPITELKIVSQFVGQISNSLTACKVYHSCENIYKSYLLAEFITICVQHCGVRT
jgi:hypothetical protein